MLASLHSLRFDPSVQVRLQLAEPLEQCQFQLPTRKVVPNASEVPVGICAFLYSLAFALLYRPEQLAQPALVLPIRLHENDLPLFDDAADLAAESLLVPIPNIVIMLMADLREGHNANGYLVDIASVYLGILQDALQNLAGSVVKRVDPHEKQNSIEGVLQIDLHSFSFLNLVVEDREAIEACLFPTHEYLVGGLCFCGAGESLEEGGAAGGEFPSAEDVQLAHIILLNKRTVQKQQAISAEEDVLQVPLLQHLPVLLAAQLLRVHLLHRLSQLLEPCVLLLQSSLVLGCLIGPLFYLKLLLFVLPDLQLIFFVRLHPPGKIHCLACCLGEDFFVHAEGLKDWLVVPSEDTAETVLFLYGKEGQKAVHCRKAFLVVIVAHYYAPQYLFFLHLHRSLYLDLRLCLFFNFWGRLFFTDRLLLFFGLFLDLHLQPFLFFGLGWLVRLHEGRLGFDLQCWFLSNELSLFVRRRDFCIFLGGNWRVHFFASDGEIHRSNQQKRYKRQPLIQLNANGRQPAQQQSLHPMPTMHLSWHWVVCGMVAALQILFKRGTRDEHRIGEKEQDAIIVPFEIPLKRQREPSGQLQAGDDWLPQGRPVPDARAQLPRLRSQLPPHQLLHHPAAVQAQPVRRHAHLLPDPDGGDHLPGHRLAGHRFHQPGHLGAQRRGGGRALPAMPRQQRHRGGEEAGSLPLRGVRHLHRRAGGAHQAHRWLRGQEQLRGLQTAAARHLPLGTLHDHHRPTHLPPLITPHIIQIHYFRFIMGNKILRPTELEPFSGFNDDQISYLRDKFDLLCDESRMLSPDKICAELMTTPEEASKILNYIDFSGEQQVDFYEFVCAAASLHQNDAEAREFIFEIYADGREMTEDSFNLLFGAVFKYLKSLDLTREDYSSEVGSAKFRKYDYNKNNSISFDEFESMIQNDFHLRLWMETLGFAKEQPQEVKEKVENHEIKNEDFAVEADEGDQFMATNAWTKVCDQMCPIPKEDYPEDKTPNIDLEISYVYGYRSYDTRDNLRYNSQGEIVYHTAGCGIVLNKAKNTMRVNTTHNDDITCLDANPARGIVATGQMGRWPSLVIWDASTLESKCIFAKKLERNISNVAISKSGKYVAASCMNEKHEIAVYDIAKNALVAFGQGPTSVIFAIKFNQSQEEVICACEKEVVFCRFASGKLEKKKGVFGKAPLNPNLAIALLGDTVITSMTSGLLVQWKGTFASKVYKQHSKSVGALCERSDGGLISGDAAGNIILWSQNMTKQRQISLQKLLGNVKSNMIRLISLFQQNGNILAGTRGGEIIQITKYSNANVVMEGHFDKQLWGLCVSLNKNEFFTAGEDKLLIKWDAIKRKPIFKKKMEYGISCLDISRNNQLAVGQKNGIVLLFDANTMNQVKKIADHKNPDRDVISALRFSPDGNTLAVGYSPPISKVYIYDLKAEKSKKVECKGASTRIVSVDFSMGGESLLATSIEPLFYKTASGGQITAVSSLKAEQWATMTSKYTWFTQGIWPPCSDGSDINAVDRSNTKKFLATADDFSKVKVFRYPVCNKKQLYNEYKGHSSHVTGVKWMYDDKTLISIGGLEKSIIQWSVNEYADCNYELEEKKEEKEEEKGEEEEYQFGEEEEEKEEDDGEIGMDVDQGDQALAVKPFLGQVKASTPLNYKPTHKNQPPPQGLKIHHVWGVRNLYINDRVRNQVRYSQSGKSCLFITAALGVQMDLKSRSQSFYQGQSDDLIAFAITKDRKYCATGQMAELNKSKPTDKIVDVHVWDADSKQQKVVLKRFHKRAVVVVEFSPSGKRILTVGQDDKNSLAVYDWQVNRIAWSSPVDGAKVTGGAWKNQNEYITVGLKHVKIWNQGKGMMQKLNGKWDPMLCVVCWNDKYVSGGSSGNVYLWGGGAGNPTKASEGTIECLAIDPKGNLFSGCSKGTIKQWRINAGKLVADKTICEVSSFDKLDPGVLSIDFFKDQMLICTSSSSIYEFPVSEKNPEPEPIMTAHCKGELWAESWSPDKQRFVTGGDDATVRIFDIKSLQQLHFFKMKEKVRGIDWEQSQGELIVVADYKGKIYLFDSELNMLDEGKTKFSKTKPRQEPFWIQDIKFSPNGKYVAFGAHGGASHLEIMQVDGKKFNQKSIIINAGMTSAMLSVDWSQESDTLVAVSQAYELKFCSLSGPVSASATRNTKWATWSGKFGFCVQEIHQDPDYSNINCVSVNPTRTLVATGGDDQRVRLFTYPVTIPKQQNKDFAGHSSHVTKVRFSADQQHLLSVGGNDRTVILWKVTGNEDKEEQVEEAENEEEEEVEEVEVEDAEEIDDIPRAKVQAKEQAKGGNEFEMDEDEGDQFMAVKPWLGAIKQPTKPYYKGSGKAPDVNLRLDYAHGYRTKDCRNNLKYLSQSQVCYHTAALGVIMKIDENPREQRFFDSHTDDIISIAWSKDRSSIFTGEMGAKPVIHQWDSSGGKSIKAYKGVKKGVSAIAVNDKYLVGSGLDDDHYIYVFDIKSGALLASEKGGRDVILGMRWVGQSSFVSVGVKHFRVWEFSGKTVKGKTGSFGQNCNILCSVQAQDQRVFTGASDGSVHIWSGNSISKSQKMHSAAVNALCLHEDILITGSNDKTIKLFKSKTLEALATINCEKLFEHSVNCSIRAIDALGKRLIVGTLGSEIYELQCKQDLIKDANSKSEFRLRGNYMNGHFAPNYVTNEVWGMALLEDDKYTTCSDDGTLRVWDIEKKEQLTWVDLKFNEKLKPMVLNPKEKFLPDSVKGRCCAVSQDRFIVIGCKDGTVRVLNPDLRPTFSKRVSQKEISHIKFSPDGTTLAIGSHDTAIYIFAWKEGQIKQRFKMAKHSSYIKHFDFTKDGNYLHSTCGAYELLFWDVNTGKQVTSGATLTRDYEWATWNVTLGWPVQGIFEPCTDGTDINSIDRTKKTFAGGMNLIATGNDSGEIRVLEYPCLVKNSESVKGRGHSSHVTTVLFNLNDELLFSTGGEDQTVLQWVLESE